MGLANRLVDPGQALTAAVALADDIAALPQLCLRSDRRSSYEQWGLALDDALAARDRARPGHHPGGETLEGAARFAAGDGRHGSFG